jgi:hypothetical protein
MPLKSSYFRNLLLAFYVMCYSAGLFHWARVVDQFDFELLPKAVAHGLLIGLVYFGFQTKEMPRLKGSFLLSLTFVAPASVTHYLFERACMASDHIA